MMRRISLLFLLLTAFLFLGCKPKYPKCDKDKQCSKKKAGEVCVSGKCVQCKDDAGCDKGESCEEGVCEEIDGFCQSKNDCDQGELCKNSRCTPGCELSADCAKGQKCLNQECAGADKCTSSGDCITGQECVENRCQSSTASTPINESCSLEAVFFDYNSEEIKGDNAKLLQANADCANKAENQKRPLVIRGYTDPRGTEEYNLTLGERRALIVKDYLSRLGVDPARMRTFSNGAEFAVGADEGSWSKDRRAEVNFE
jgi:peptidoglycan-associated lipoprotein